VKDDNFKIVGYLSAGGLETLDQLQLTKLTYLNLAFANPNSNGEDMNQDSGYLYHWPEGAHRMLMCGNHC